MEDINLQILRGMVPTRWHTVVVRDYLNERFSQRWIGRNGFIRWPPNSPDLTSCIIFYEVTWKGLFLL